MKTALRNIYRLIPRPVARALLWAVNAKFNFGAVGIFLTSEGKVLVLEHVYRHTYAWGLPGGYLHRGEAPEAGLLRELGEETGLAAQIDRVLMVDEADAFQKEIVFVGRIDAYQTPKLNHEIHTFAFVPPDALPAGMLPRHAALVERLRKELAAKN